MSITVRQSKSSDGSVALILRSYHTTDDAVQELVRSNGVDSLHPIANLLCSKARYLGMLVGTSQVAGAQYLKLNKQSRQSDIQYCSKAEPPRWNRMMLIAQSKTTSIEKNEAGGKSSPMPVWWVLELVAWNF